MEQPLLTLAPLGRVVALYQPVVLVDGLAARVDLQAGLRQVVVPPRGQLHLLIGDVVELVVVNAALTNLSDFGTAGIDDEADGVGRIGADELLDFTPVDVVGVVETVVAPHPQLRGIDGDDDRLGPGIADSSEMLHGGFTVDFGPLQLRELWLGHWSLAASRTRQTMRSAVR